MNAAAYFSLINLLITSFTASSLHSISAVFFPVVVTVGSALFLSNSSTIKIDPFFAAICKGVR